MRTPSIHLVALNLGKCGTQRVPGKRSDTYNLFFAASTINSSPQDLKWFGEVWNAPANEGEAPVVRYVAP